MAARPPGRRTDEDTDPPAPAAAPEFVQVAFQLPKFYLRVLDNEAEVLGRMRRSVFLELLVLRKAGLCKFERVATQKYRPEPGELEELERYLWHCRIEIKRLLDRLRTRLGNLPPRSWVVLALNEWIGLPGGVSDLSPVEAAAFEEAETDIKPIRE